MGSPITTPTTVPTSLTEFVGRRVEVLPQAFMSLVVMGEPFLLYIHSSDNISQRFTPVLDQYLEFIKTNMLVLALNLTDHPSAVDIVEAVMVPQLRLFSHGKLIRKHVGTADYAILNTLLGVVH